MEYVAPYLPVITLSGYVEAGKDTVATMLKEHLTLMELAFADKLRESLERLDPWVRVRPFDFGERPGPALTLMRLNEALKAYGSWDWLKRHNPVEIRELMQKQGHLCRDIFGRECWARAMAKPVVMDLYAQAANCCAHWHNKQLEAILIKDRRQPWEDNAFFDAVMDADTAIRENRGPFKYLLGPIRVWVERTSKGPVNDADSEQHYAELKRQAHYTIVNAEWLPATHDAPLRAEVSKFFHWLQAEVIHAPTYTKLERWA